MGFSVLISFAVTLVGFLLIVILVLRNRQPSAKFLALALISMNYAALMIFMYESRYILLVPHLVRTAPFFNLLTVPLVYMYALFALNIRTKVYWRDLLHLLPAILYLADFSPVLFSSATGKLQSVQAILDNPKLTTSMQDGWFLPPVHYLARHIIAAGYLISLFLLLTKYRKTNPGFRNNIVNYKWVLTIAVIFSTFTIVSIITHLFFPQRNAWLYLSLNLLLVYIVMSLQLFFRPWILYGSMPKINAEGQRAPAKPNIRTALPENVMAELEEKMKIYISDKLYLRRNITIKDVAAELSVQQYILSAFINQQYDMHFNDLINYHRVQFIRAGLMNGEWERLTLEAVAHKAGFNNRTTFINAFKKFTGMVPSEYISKVKRDDASAESNEQMSPV